MKKKTQRIYATILTVLISIAMIGSGFLGYFFGGGIPPNGSTTGNDLANYQAQKVTIDAMVQQAKLDPENVALQTALGNQYYDAGVAAEVVAPTETEVNFKNAVEAYQKVLKTNKDPNVMVDMATAAFKSGDDDLADKTFKEALALKPDFYNGLVNYGIFLANERQDMPAAIVQWQKAQEIAQTSAEKDQMKSFISQAQGQLNSGATGGLSNPTLKK